MNILDKDWRLRNLYFIIDKDGRKILFAQNKIQEIINKNKANRKIILKARQFGISTNEIIKQFDFVCFSRNKTACILAHENDAIEKLFRIPKRAYEFMDGRIKPRLDRGGGSKFEMYFPENNSRIYCDLESRGDTIHWLHVSEAAFMKDSAKLKSTMQAVPLNGGIITIETTANGMANYFYDLWNENNDGFERLFFPWFMHEEYKIKHEHKIEITEEEKEFINKTKKLYNIDISTEQINYRRYKKLELKTSAYDKIKITFEQEYPEDDQTCFLSSMETPIDLFKIKSLLDKLQKPLDDKGYLRIYEKVKNNELYVIGADTAEGVNKDLSAAVVIGIKSRKVVAVLSGNWKPREFADHLNQLGQLYKNKVHNVPLLAVERNNHGHAVILAMNEIIQYENLYVSPKDERLGWKTDNISRSIMVDQAIEAIENDHIDVTDKYILQECLTLVNVNGKIQAAENKHDDLFIAFAIAFQMFLVSNNLSLYENIEKRIFV